MRPARLTFPAHAGTSSSPRGAVRLGAAATASLLLLGGCAVTPAAQPAPAGSESAPATQPSVSTSVTPTPTATVTPTSPPDPLAHLSAAKRKQFKACLPKTLRAGSSGTCVTLLQTELKKAGFYPWAKTRYVSVAGANAILNYQRSRGLDADGWVGKDTWLALATKAPTVSKELPKTCFTKGVVLCVDQAHRTLTWLRNGKVVKKFKVRLGGYAQHAKTHIWRNFPTANGTWKVYDKQVNPASENYGSGAMPYSTMFYPDMYVHYSSGFNRVGYAQSSHGCVNIGKLSDAIWIFKNTPIGAKVHIFSPRATA
ncbi:MAG: L,D-transpeptidase family protein [Micropruina sp.]|uniref:L,D-transpeptidase family protein n=1 Tax=Micropruina sp. TaxID=2737536 RepID=UPI0039E5CD07